MKIKFIKIRSILFLIILLIITSCIDDPFSNKEDSYIEGTVTDATDNYSLHNVRVELLNPTQDGDNVANVTYTNADGYYKFSKSLEYQYIFALRFKKDGYEEVRYPRFDAKILYAGKTFSYNVKMNPIGP